MKSKRLPKLFMKEMIRQLQINIFQNRTSFMNSLTIKKSNNLLYILFNLLLIDKLKYKRREDLVHLKIIIKNLRMNSQMMRMNKLISYFILIIII